MLGFTERFSARLCRAAAQNCWLCTASSGVTMPNHSPKTPARSAAKLASICKIEPVKSNR